MCWPRDSRRATKSSILKFLDLKHRSHRKLSNHLEWSFLLLFFCKYFYTSECKYGRRLVSHRFILDVFLLDLIMMILISEMIDNIKGKCKKNFRRSSIPWPERWVWITSNSMSLIHRNTRKNCFRSFGTVGPRDCQGSTSGECSSTSCPSEALGNRRETVCRPLGNDGGS